MGDEQTILQLLEDRERKGYERGCLDTDRKWAARLAELIAEVPPVEEETAGKVIWSAPRRPRMGRPAKAKTAVLNMVLANPSGLTGVQVVGAVQARMPEIPERTIRTSLRRLMLAKQIRRVEGKWYPNASGEVLGTPPR